MGGADLHAEIVDDLAEFFRRKGVESGGFHALEADDGHELEHVDEVFCTLVAEGIELHCGLKHFT